MEPREQVFPQIFSSRELSPIPLERLLSAHRSLETTTVGSSASKVGLSKFRLHGWKVKPQFSSPKSTRSLSVANHYPKQKQ